MKPVVLIVLDGWGHRDETQNNGIALAAKPFFDSLWQSYPHTLIDGSGPAVGLPAGIMGNSEVGHMNLGAGRIMYSGLSQIYHAIETGEFFNNTALLKAITHAKTKNSALHLMGLLSDGAVHSHEDHLYALLKMAKQNDVNNVQIHCFLDGRDTAPRDGLLCLQRLKQKISEFGIGRIASVGGRYFGMDRDKNWERTEKAFASICGQGPSVHEPEAYVRECYAKDVTDEFVPPVAVQGTSFGADDAMIFFNFRADRARQISRMILDSGKCAVFVAMTPYDTTLNCPAAFLPTYPKNTLPEILAERHLKQLRIAETEKYAHVTFFFQRRQRGCVAGRRSCFDSVGQNRGHLRPKARNECVRSA